MKRISENTLFFIDSSIYSSSGNLIRGHSEGIGYIILLGVGLVKAIAVTLLVRVGHKWLGTRKTFEWFYTAGRNVMTGLIAAPLVSAWTWQLPFFNLLL